jgi:hypothetical protein
MCLHFEVYEFMYGLFVDNESGVLFDVISSVTVGILIPWVIVRSID